MILDRYQILKELGQGACGRTFLAWDFGEPSREHCVIKQFDPKPAIKLSPESRRIALERFQREAPYLKRLSKRNDQIPKLYEFVEESGEFYIIQEWIDGKTLKDEFREEGKFYREEATNVVLSVLSVLIDVHAQGIIHRDIKPDNIILRVQDRKHVLIDFGVVKEIITTITDPYGKSSDSIIVGTPDFMAPEQAIGEPVFSSDLYSLGFTIIFLLTGKLRREIPLFSTGDFRWRQFARGSGRLATVLNKAIRRDYHDRYSSAVEMRDALFADQQIETAMDLISRDRNFEAETAARKAVQLNPGNAEAHYVLAQALHSRYRPGGLTADKEKYVEAEAEALIAVAMKPDNLAHYALLSATQSLQGHDADSKVTDEKHSEIRTQQASVWNCREKIWRQWLPGDRMPDSVFAAYWGLECIPDWELAEVYFQESVQLDPSNADVNYLWGQAFHRLGCHDEAKAQLNKAKRLDPNTDFALY